jgi:ATP-dependent Clp protease ATP-binding subunit ClpA
MDLFGFTDRARKALTLAADVSRRFNQPEITPEHIFVAMIELADGMDLLVLANLLADTEGLKSAVESKLARGQEEAGGSVELSPVGKRLIEEAVKEARLLNHSYIGKEHLLLALARDSAGVPAEALREQGITYEQVRTEVTRILSAAAPKELKRYNLALPEDLFREVERLAQRQNTTVVEVLRRFVKLGLYVTAVQESPDGAVLVRQDGREREIVLL